MGLKSDKWIREKSLSEAMITPFCEGLVGEGVVSYGLSSYGYDIRVADEFKIFTNINAEVVDPKDFSENNVVDHKGDICIVPPNSFALARTVEYFKMPSDTLAICLGKSTYARCGIIVNVTPFEPGFEGHITIEISNTTPFRQRSTPTKGSLRFSFWRETNSVKPLIRIEKENTKAKGGSRFPVSLRSPRQLTCYSCLPWVKMLPAFCIRPLL